VRRQRLLQIGGRAGRAEKEIGGGGYGSVDREVWMAPGGVFRGGLANRGGWRGAGDAVRSG
jgi:hypothetical protein